MDRLACVAGGIVSASEIKFWRRSRQARGDAARRMGSGTSGGSAAKILFRARAHNTASYAGYGQMDKWKLINIDSDEMILAIALLIRHYPIRSCVNCQIILRNQINGLIWTDLGTNFDTKKCIIVPLWKK